LFDTIRTINFYPNCNIPIVWFLNTAVFTQLNLRSSSMILFYSIINLYNQSLTVIDCPGDLTRLSKFLCYSVGSRNT